MGMGGPLWSPAVALGLAIIALHPRAATRAPTPPNSSPGLKCVITCCLHLPPAAAAQAGSHVSATRRLWLTQGVPYARPVA